MSEEPAVVEPPTNETKKRPFEPTEPGQAWRGHHEDAQVIATVEYDKAGKKQKAEEKFKDVQVSCSTSTLSKTRYRFDL